MWTELQLWQRIRWLRNSKSRNLTSNIARARAWHFFISYSVSSNFCEMELYFKFNVGIVEWWNCRWRCMFDRATNAEYIFIGPIALAEIQILAIDFHRRIVATAWITHIPIYTLPRVIYAQMFIFMFIPAYCLWSSSQL